MTHTPTPVTAAGLAASLCEAPIVGKAAIALRQIAQCYEDVRVHKVLSGGQKKAKHMVNKCAQLLNTLDEQCLELTGAELQSRVDEVTVVYDNIEKRVREWSRYNRMTVLFKSSEIQRGIEFCERELDRCQMNLTAIIGNHNDNHNRDEAEEMRDLLHQILANRGGVEPQALQESLPPNVKLLNGEVVKIGDLAVAGGTYCDIWQGVWLGKTKVALKTLRNIKAADPTAQKRFLKQMNIWADLHHDHILPFYGVVTDQGQYIEMVSPWLDNGNVLDYVKNTPDAKKIHLLSGAAQGLGYLHARNITHGNVRCANIIVSSTGEAYICDFGMSRAIEVLTENNAAAMLTAAGSARWLAPELIEGVVTSPTKETDTYSYAMAILELLTGKHPFSNRRRDASVIHDIVVLKKIPLRPTEPEVLPWLTDDLWTLMTKCWERPASSRPSMSQVSTRIQDIEGPLGSETIDLSSSEDHNPVNLRQISHESSTPPSPDVLDDDIVETQDVEVPLSNKLTQILPDGHEQSGLVARLQALLTDRGKYKQLLARRDSNAQGLLDMFQRLLDVLEMSPSSFRRDLIVATQRLAGASGLYPACYELENVTRIGDEFESSGGFADVYKGSFQSRLVCLKEIRFNGKTETQHFFKACSKEAILWGQLSHPNILPFYGIGRSGNRVSLISPWMEHGDINNYLRKNPSANRAMLVFDVAQGLRFLHQSKIIHGDLKGPNILVNESGRACVADFGISSISDPDILAWTSHSAVASKGGSVRWQAPELFDPGDEDAHNTAASDMYAWSCVTYEVFAGQPPFAHISRNSAVLLKVVNGERPVRPLDSSLSWSTWGLTENLWSLMQDCWTANPTDRPTVDRVIARLKQEMPRGSTRLDKRNVALSPARFRETARERSTDDDLSVSRLERLLSSV